MPEDTPRLASGAPAQAAIVPFDREADLNFPTRLLALDARNVFIKGDFTDAPLEAYQCAMETYVDRFLNEKGARHRIAPGVLDSARTRIARSSSFPKAFVRQMDEWGIDGAEAFLEANDPNEKLKMPLTPLWEAMLPRLVQLRDIVKRHRESMAEILNREHGSEVDTDAFDEVILLLPEGTDEHMADKIRTATDNGMGLIAHPGSIADLPGYNGASHVCVAAGDEQMFRDAGKAGFESFFVPQFNNKEFASQLVGILCSFLASSVPAEFIHDPRFDWTQEDRDFLRWSHERGANEGRKMPRLT